jgi:16S rRNA G1207 methylase RsmC
VGDHYFTARPASVNDRREIAVEIAGQDANLTSAPGVFSPDRIDLGTRVLLRAVPPPPAGNLLDLGCGWGPIALTMAALRPDATVWAVDVNERALDLVRANAERLATGRDLARVEAVTPDAVPADLVVDALWSNPPIRVGKDALHALLAAWIPRLRSGAEAHLVVQRNLGADSLIPWVAAQRGDDGRPWGAVDKVASAKGYRVIRVTRG